MASSGCGASLSGETMMKILVIGNGGREHALVWKIRQSPRVGTLYCAPGNPGIAKMAQCVSIQSGDIEGLLAFALENEIDLTVVGPEAPLAAGIVDHFEEKGLKIFGPSKRAAEIESSKVFSKELMLRYGIPTARGESFDNAEKALQFAKRLKGSVVVKADGLAAGKGVFVCNTVQEAEKAIQAVLKDQLFGAAGSRIIVEETLRGEEVSFIAFTDGVSLLPLPSSQDHKALSDGDLGPNTGGMGAYSPAPVMDYFMQQKIMKEVMEPTVRAMAFEGRPFRGVLYAGLMIQKDCIHVLEFNARLGDPEAQALLPRIESDLVELMEAVVENRLDKAKVRISPKASVCIVMAAGGYPGDYEKGDVIHGLNEAEGKGEAIVFHAGTREDSGKILTNGGRILGVTVLNDTVELAMKAAYTAVSKISFNNCHYRKDIALKAIKRLQSAPRVGIIMGSDSDLPIMLETVAVLKKFDIPYEMTVASAHRTPEKVQVFASTAKNRGMGVLVAGAGHAAHLAGVIAAHTTLPVLGVPIDSSVLKGMDALLSTVQMPPGVPVATLAIGKPGAYNAGILAVQILAAQDEKLSEKLAKFKKEMASKVEEKARILEP